MWPWSSSAGPPRHACRREIERSVKAEGQVVLGWREVPVNHDMPMSPTVAPMEPVIGRCSWAAGGRFRHRRARAQTLHHPPPRCQRRQVAQAEAWSGILRSVVFPRGRSSTGFAACASGWRVLPRPADKRAVSAWRWCTSASRPTPSRPGISPIPSATLPTTARSTPSRQRQLVPGPRAGDFSPILGKDLDKVWPLIYPDQSDSASFDNALGCSSWAAIRWRRRS